MLFVRLMKYFPEQSMACPLEITHDDMRVQGPIILPMTHLFQLEITENEVCLIAVRPPWASLMFKS